MDVVDEPIKVEVCPAVPEEVNKKAVETFRKDTELVEFIRQRDEAIRKDWEKIREVAAKATSGTRYIAYAKPTGEYYVIAALQGVIIAAVILTGLIIQYLTG